jgi:hypothetical protein
LDAEASGHNARFAEEMVEALRHRNIGQIYCGTKLSS